MFARDQLPSKAPVPAAESTDLLRELSAEELQLVAGGLPGRTWQTPAEPGQLAGAVAQLPGGTW